MNKIESSQTQSDSKTEIYRWKERGRLCQAGVEERQNVRKIRKTEETGSVDKGQN